ncbi:DUF6129 family protein [Azonexus caeni]|uniref:DUF6129 family protein n=1 Tax=Azonexus caeni TaxID=266126 RepID=UPI003A8A2377
MTPERLAEVVSAVERGDNASTLRASFSELIFTECSEDDISPRLQAVATTPAALIYLITGISGHCLEATSDLAVANGVIIAGRDSDE